MRTLVACLIFSLFLIATAVAAPPVIGPSVQASIRQRVDFGYNPGIAVGMATADGRAFFAYGVGDITTRQPLTEQSLFEIGSVTKVFTTTLLARLVEQGGIALSDRIQDLLPAQVNAPTRNGVEITLEHLATHSSGLPYIPPNLSGAYLDNPFADYTTDKLYDFLNSYALPRTPGAAYEYSNLGMGLLGYALSLRAGLSYEQLLRERVLDPLGLRNTRIVLAPSQLTRQTTGYSGIVSRPRFAMASLDAAGSLLSSVGDMLTFLEFYAKLRTNELAGALANATNSRRATDLPGISIGLGWWLLPVGGDTIVFHEGNTLGYSAFAGYRRNSKTAVVVLTNARVNRYANIEDIGLNLLGYPISFTTIQRPAAIPLELIRKYHGFYQASNGSFFDIRLQNGFLTFSFSNASNLFSTFYPQSSRQVQVLDPGVNAFGIFNTNSTGKVISLTWNQNNATDIFARQTTPAKLAISPEAVVTLTGDSQLTYALESTPNFREWRPISTNTIWTNPIKLPLTTQPQFIRAISQE